MQGMLDVSIESSNESESIETLSEDSSVEIEETDDAT